MFLLFADSKPQQSTFVPQAPPTVFVQQQQPTVIVQPQPTVIVQQRPVVVVRSGVSQAEEIFNRGINDLNRAFAPTYVTTVTPNQVAAVCAHCRAQIMFTRVGVPVQVKCWNCPHVNTFQ